ncbi:MAG TPA: hypothetical protein DEE98_07270 [Elusimicrobia bacterium]|nr:MAG: hypothetical protein A2278_00095 [Elusimicrobia bacterium RIFOXYA12_FULL_49_49]OGS11458.1 MAG: hypothetical protein A2386_00025 [Elusimicrobia bacterium RIFOXYB1_FULL_48_9]OGS15837.1 MAG: hypothetical protein A2251_04230 [Elusimicrobia bacterium RIFOXYA2_FULL_47_53]OGS27131.1 MAG: hypothetical protein A2339_00480 [Elusimicrobia bacterium RIFOXYB12_FULL_50_12]OGS31169.1 MAG: hypothetical protein A2323_08950 [Elusimicrobia bacterium RIFOXYB2_FULL_46_23]HBU70165.1 hypothetical protein [El
MRSGIVFCFAVFAALLSGLSENLRADEGWGSTPGLYAVFSTTKGEIVCKLYEKETPKTVANFTELAEGRREFIDPKTGQKTTGKFYDGLIFHRVIPNFMIQGGCPLGNGMGGPGYRFEDEFVPGLNFDIPGRLAMANSGPNTNGSQFFITEVATPWLNSRHTIFGQVVAGQSIVNLIARVKRGQADRPVEPVVLKKLTIKRIGGTQETNAPVKTGPTALLIVAPEMYNEEEYDKTRQALVNAGVTVVTASLKKGALSGMSGGTAESELLITDVKTNEYDAVVFIGGEGSQVYWANQQAHQIAKDSYARNKIVAAICLAPGTLSNAGLLKGKRVTGFMSLQAEFQKAGAQYSDKPVEKDGNIITGSGPEASEAFGSAVAEALK